MVLKEKVKGILYNIPQPLLTSIYWGITGILLLIVGLISYQTWLSMQKSPETVLQVSVFPKQANPGDTVAYTFEFSFLYGAEKEVFKELSGTLAQGYFLPMTELVEPLSLDSAWVLSLADSNNFSLRPSDPNADLVLDEAQKFRFSLKAVLPYELELVGKSYEEMLCLSLGDQDYAWMHSTQQLQEQSIELPHYELAGKVIEGELSPGSAITYEVTITNPATPQGGIFNERNGLLHFQAFLSSSYLAIDPNTIEIRSKRKFDSPLVAQNTLYVDGLEMHPGDEIVLRYEIMLNEMIPLDEAIVHHVAAFVPDTQISGTAEHRLGRLSEKLLGFN